MASHVFKVIAIFLTVLLGGTLAITLWCAGLIGIGLLTSQLPTPFEWITGVAAGFAYTAASFFAGAYLFEEVL